LTLSSGFFRFFYRGLSYLPRDFSDEMIEGGRGLGLESGKYVLVGHLLGISPYLLVR
jgi:hypothetical protein